MATRKKTAEQQEVAVEEKLKMLYKLQSYLSEIDRIKTLRGELPLEVADLDDEIAGLNTRIHNFELEIQSLKEATIQQQKKIAESKAKIEKYNNQLDNVRNSKEYDHLSKEIEFETLEIELAEKHIREYAELIKNTEEQIAAAKEQLKEKSIDLEQKKKNSTILFPKPKRRKKRFARGPKRLKPVSIRVCWRHSNVFARMRATVWVLFPFSVEPAEVVLTKFRHRSRWILNWVRKLSFANIADAS